MKLTATKVSQKLGVSVTTLTNWYKWYTLSALTMKLPKDCPELPPYEQDHPRGIRYWNPEDLPKLVKFKKWIPKGRGGVMGEYNSRFWGARGKKKPKTDL